MTDDARRVLELAKGLPEDQLASIGEALALELSHEHRASVAAALIESLSGGSDQSAVDAAWSAEIGRRLQAVRDGAPLGDRDEALERARLRLEERRRSRHG